MATIQGLKLGIEIPTIAGALRVTEEFVTSVGEQEGLLEKSLLVPRIVARLKQGATATSISRELHCSKRFVSDAARKSQISLRSGPKPWRRIQILGLLDEGLSRPEIARKLRIKREHIRVALSTARRRGELK